MGFEKLFTGRRGRTVAPAPGRQLATLAELGSLEGWALRAWR